MTLTRTGFLVVFVLLAAVIGCSSDERGLETAMSEQIDPGLTPTMPDVVATATDDEELSPQETEIVGPQVETPSVPATPQTKPTQEALDTPGAEEATPPVETPTETPTRPGAPVTSIALELVISGFERPTFLTHAGDDRLFITEQPGRIWLITDGQRSTEPFLDIRDRISSSALEQGLLSMAFHPEYKNNGLFYVNYTDDSGDTTVSSFQVSSSDPNLADASSESVLMKVDQPYGNHNGGQISFGPDGYLYIGMGDGGSAGDPGNHGQNQASLLGSLLRIDVDGSAPYGIPGDNPFRNDSSARGETWAIGLRNPWRFSFDRLTGDLFIADVGQNQWEEVNFQPAHDPGGANYGWRIVEASHCYASEFCDSSAFDRPIAEYSHAEGGCSITGGYIYRGQAHPSFAGNYFFGDYCSGTIWSLFDLGDGAWQRSQAAQIRASISSFGEDYAGEIYVIDQIDGAVYRIIP